MYEIWVKKGKKIEPMSWDPVYKYSAQATELSSQVGPGLSVITLQTFFSQRFQYKRDSLSSVSFL